MEVIKETLKEKGLKRALSLLNEWIAIVKMFLVSFLFYCTAQKGQKHLSSVRIDIFYMYVGK